jgi:hypothetical protein
MTLREIRALVDAGDYAAYADDVTDDWTATSMANLWNDYEFDSLDSEGYTKSTNHYMETLAKLSYTVTFQGQSPIYIKKKLNNIYILQWQGTNCRYLYKKMEPDYKWTISELKAYMETDSHPQGFKVYSYNQTASEANADEIYQLVFDKEVLYFEQNGMFRFIGNNGNEGSTSSTDFYICPYSDPSPID